MRLLSCGYYASIQVRLKEWYMWPKCRISKKTFMLGACPSSPSRCVLRAHWMCPCCAQITCSSCYYNYIHPLYFSDAGNLEINSMTLTSELDSTLTLVLTLTCTSTGGPTTTVSWTVNNHTVTEDSAHHITSQILTDPVTATYTHTLTVTGRLVGEYKCNVSNNKPSTASRSLRVRGE